MGVVRYLCITILLVAAVFADCGPNGAANVHGECICRAGYAPSDATQADCVDFTGNCAAGLTFATASEKKDDRFPVLSDVINLRANTLSLALLSAVVPSRKYNNISFVGGSNAQCTLQAGAAKSFWSQGAVADATHCQDKFQLAMPWDQWRTCGFVLDTTPNPDYYVFRSTFVIDYTDNIGSPYVDQDTSYAPVLYRHSAVSYKVWVSFQKHIDLTVYLQATTVDNTVGLKAAITKFEYNPMNSTLRLGVSTVVLWPNMFDRDTVSISIADNTHLTASPYTPIYGASPAETDVLCREDESNCLQYYEFEVPLEGANCDFDGHWIISGTVYTCRDTHACTSASQSATLLVTLSDVCGSVTAEPKIDGKLESFDVDGVTPKTEFELGYKGVFGVDMTTKNDFNLTWIDIWVLADEDVPSNTDVNFVGIQKIQWLYREYQVQTNGFHKYDNTDFGDFGVSPVGLIVHDVVQDSRHATDVVFTPRFEFRFDARIFHLPVAGQVKKGFTLHARGKITYAGNEQYGRKRSEEYVDFAWEAPTKGFEGSVRFGLAQPTTAAVAPAAGNSNVALLASLVPVAGIALVVIAVAVIAAVIIRRKKATSFATLN